MLSYKQACDQAGYDRSVQCPIKPNIVYFAYKCGVATEFKTKAEAQAISKNVETVTTNMAECDAWWNERKALEAKACNIWYAALKNEWVEDGESSELFEACYSEAYDRGHSSGYDEVASYFNDIWQFTCKIRTIIAKEYNES